MGFLDMNALFGKKNKSSSVAKDRLKLVLIHDRMNCSTELLEMMRADILEVISKYVDIDTEELNIEIANTLQLLKPYALYTTLSLQIYLKIFFLHTMLPSVVLLVLASILL